MSYTNPGALASTEWLAANLDNPGVRIVDATWFMPNVERSGRAEYNQGHIQGAVFWDLDGIADRADPLPHMVPDNETFAAAMASLGIADGARVVVYDGAGMSTSARVWWTLRYFGHDDVAILDGGLKKWLAEGRPIDTAAPSPGGQKSGEQVFTARPRPSLVRNLEQIRNNIASTDEQVIDARAAGRFDGTEPEPRPNCRSGHIPGSVNLPFTRLIDRETGTFLAADALAARFAEAGIDMMRPIATTCGSGVTACVLALGLYLLGHDGVAVYDGSWTEWGCRDDTPIDT